MPKLTLDISMSLDGFIAGPNQTLEQPLGEGGDQLHEWVFGLASWREPHGLSGGEPNADGWWGDVPPFHVPVFVLTHHARETVTKQGGTSYTFVTDGIEAALEQARAAAGDKDVALAGGATVVQQALKAGLLDQLQIHLAPVLLGDGVSLFDRLGADAPELEVGRVVASPSVTHLRFGVAKGASAP